jgi:parvulin-like peptidyl-prolyl isomerase
MSPATKLLKPLLTPRAKRLAMMAASALLVLSVALVCRRFLGASVADAQAPAAPQQEIKQANANIPKHQPPQHDVMALVNGQDINRRQLEQACVERYGEEVLESLVNKHLIMHHCQKRGIVITNQDIEDEVNRMAKRFKLGPDQLLEFLESERGVKAAEYKRDILWPTLALRRLAETQLTVTEEEIEKEYESQFGPSVRVRIIILPTAERAQQVQRQLTTNPDDFARIAMNESIDVNSASIGGLIQPIRRHVGDPGLEQAAFGLQPGQISAVIPVANQFAILKCEGHNPPRQVDRAMVREELTERIREGKLREVASQTFQSLQESASIVNILNDPVQQQRMPGVVATVNGNQITMAELAKEAMARHGEDVLEVEIAHKLLEQALAKANLTVTQEDINAEIAHAAQLSGVVDQAGQPKVAEWIKLTTEEQGISEALYIRDSVWPSAALKKLAGAHVEVTQEDLQKGYEANYAERVRCRAIVLANMRRAQEVWQKARANDSFEYFGDLAEEYSIEPTSKSLRGEVPPIQRHGGQPQLEKEAFSLKPGQLSGIVQVGDKFIILKCEGRTEPVEVNMNDVRQILTQDIYEKKLRVAMSQKYDEIRQAARIDNYLAGTTQAPVQARNAEPREGSPAPRRDTAVRPTSGNR